MAALLYLSIFPFGIDIVFFSPFSIWITSLGEERVNLSAFLTAILDCTHAWQIVSDPFTD